MVTDCNDCCQKEIVLGIVMFKIRSKVTQHLMGSNFCVLSSELIVDSCVDLSSLTDFGPFKKFKLVKIQEVQTSQD